MAMTLITTNTSSNASASAFTSSIDSTYKLYIFKFIDINPATDNVNFQWQVSTDGGSGYTSLTTTSTAFSAGHGEDDSGGSLGYSSSDDLAQSTSAITICSASGNDADQSIAGELHLFNPSDTTYVKHFYSRVNNSHTSDHVQDAYGGGYVNSTSDVDAVRFIMSSGNFAGTIKMYGVG